MLQYFLIFILKPILKSDRLYMLIKKILSALFNHIKILT